MELLSFGDRGWGDELARATAMTIAVASCAFLLGLVVGSIGTYAKLSRSIVVATAADAYTTIVRGIPELLIIYLLFFGGSGALMFFARMFGHTGYVEINAFATGVCAIAIVNGAYSLEVIRGAVLAVPRGQIEAAKAFGMSPWILFRRVLAPQVLRFALPGLGNVWQLALKETALISVTGLVEIMRQSTVGAGSTKQPFTFYAVACVLYLTLTTVSGFGFSRAERWANRGVRSA
ncbi:MAG: ABC transporter permease [Alphaproteobacteria bacterium]|nr:ABC transporter permease [Alphaproteobacteria bacterium]